MRAIGEAPGYDDLTDQRILLDCRWLGMGGAGRVTELLLRGLAEMRPAGHWLLWGPESVRGFQWKGSLCHRSHHSPLSLMGQRELPHVPAHDIALYMHQIRPFRPGRAVTFVYDTIPLRYGGSHATRLFKRIFFRTSSALSERIITCSSFSKTCIESDLQKPSAAVLTVRLPIDQESSARIRSLRARTPLRNFILYVGRFAEHKNLRRLIAGFQRTRLCRDGGELLLIGGSDLEVRDLRTFATDRGMRHVRIQGRCSQEQLEVLYATARLLVMPSLEEGFGLPAWEAMASALPICVSDGGALPEVTVGVTTPFPARSITAIQCAIDRDTEPHHSDAIVERGLRMVQIQPSPSQFAAQVVQSVRP